MRKSNSPVYCILCLLAISLCGCASVGPSFSRPGTMVSQDWVEAEDVRIGREPVNYRDWWRVFNDPTLDGLIDTAYRRNLSLRIAGVRVLEARAQLALVAGRRYPQTQQAFGLLQYNRASEHSALSGSGGNPAYTQDEVGLSASWEIDFWGKFRRAIESADASWMASVADFDSALVALTADVANLYISLRTLEKRIEIASQNVDIQTEALKIAVARLREGTTSERDVAQARTILDNTRASIPALETQLRQARHALSVLLGLPPGHLPDMPGPSIIPLPPVVIAAGIPADLLRRRPDIRRMEYLAMAQSAQIGVAKADLYPSFSLSGTFGFLSTDVGGSRLSDVLGWKSRTYAVGPEAQWNILNYGRLVNAVRVEDARFQQTLIAYQDAVLRAQQEVEDGLVAFLRARERAEFLAVSAESAQRSLDIATAQYREGATDFTVVLTSQQALLAQQDNLASAMGDISRNTVAVYRALGGGWQIREEMEAIPDDVKKTMAERTNWGELLNRTVYMPSTYVD